MAAGMNGCRIRGVVVSALIALATPVWGAGAADGYPARPIRLLGQGAGGTADVLSRLIGPRLTEKWGQPVVVDNRQSAGGIVPAETAARADPDGHTLFMGNAIALVNAPFLFKKLPYDPIRDFAPITMVATTTNVLVVHASVPVASVTELIAYARKKPGLTYGTVGPGSLGHLTGELLKQLTGIDLTHVPYRGGGPAVIGIVSGEVQISFLAPLTAYAQLKSGKIRVLAVTSRKRSPAVPDAPSSVEAGVPELEALLWFGLFAPARTPLPIVMKLNQAVAETLRRGDVREAILKQGGDPSPSSPEELGNWVKSEMARWGPVIRKGGIQAN